MKEWICRELSTSTRDAENGILMMETELIRCKDCRYFRTGENPSETWSLCIAHINRYFETCEENYCSWAERKEE